MINFSINKFNNITVIHWQIKHTAKNIRFLDKNEQYIYIYSCTSGYIDNNSVINSKNNVSITTDFCDKIDVFLDNDFQEFFFPLVEATKEIQKIETNNNFKCILSKNNELLSINFVKKESRKALFVITSDLLNNVKNDYVFIFDLFKDNYSIPLSILPKGSIFCCLMNKNAHVENIYHKVLISNTITN